MSPEQSELSAQALLNIRPNDAFVTDLIKHWWREPAPAISLTQQPSAQPSSELPSALNVQDSPLVSVSMTEGHFQSGQSLAPFTAGHPQASGIDTLTDKLLGDAGPGPPAGPHALSNPSPIRHEAAPERTNCSVQDDTATAAAAAADQHADVAEFPSEQAASSLMPERQSADQTSYSSFSALQSSYQTPSALPAHQTSPSSEHITAGSEELPVSSAQASSGTSASQQPSSSGHVSPTSQHPYSSSHQLPAASHSSSASDAGQDPSSSSGQAQEAGHSPAASVSHAQAASMKHTSSSSFTPPDRHQPPAEPSTGWQHYRESGSGNRGTDTHSARNASGDEDEGGAGLKGWVEEVQQHEEQLTQKVCGHAARFDFACALASDFAFEFAFDLASFEACLHTMVLLAD